MTRKLKFLGIVVAIIALPALVAAVPATSLQEEHHSGAMMKDQEAAQTQGHHEATARQEKDEKEWACPMAGKMMAMMQRHMGMMQRMMGHMHDGGMVGSGPGEMCESGCSMHGREHGKEGAGMHGMMPGKKGAGMHGMMGGFDPAAVEDPEKADEMAEMLRARAERMRAHLQEIDERAAALEARAEELRSGDESGEEGR